MAVTLQNFGFRESSYERPQDKWVCGHLAEGKPCPLGPSAKGHCGARAACEPFLENNRWQCRRSDLQGGPCEAGPLPDGRCCHQQEPCAPRRSLRHKRRNTAIWATILCIGLITFFAAGQSIGHYLMPGQLSSSHASLTECKTCHEGVSPTGFAWLHSAVASVDPRANAKLCISCHELGETPFSPHTHPIDQLERLTAKQVEGASEQPIRQDSWLHTIALPVPNKDPKTGVSNIMCATCHEEHQGSGHDQKFVSNARCQTCHVSKLGSFEQSHPEYSDFPFERRTRIIFNHKSHFKKHFPKTNDTGDGSVQVPSVCADCHTPGTDLRYMEIKSYKLTCAGCHEDDILGNTRATGPKGIDFLAVPGIDVPTLVEHGVDIGSWPVASDVEVSVFLKALIAADPGGAEVVNGVAKLDLLDLTGASDEELAKVATFAWAVKNLFNQWETIHLSEALSNLPDNPGGRKVDRTQLGRLTDLISHDVIMSANRAWFPNLKDDLERYGRNEPTKAFASLRKVPDVVPSPLGEDIPPVATEDPNAKDGEILAPPEESILEDSDDSSEDLEALTDDPDKKEPPEDGLLDLDSEDAEESDLLGTPDDPPATAEKPASKPADEDPLPEFNPEAWAEFGGWYRQDFTIRYRPLGHADRFLKAWLDYSAHAYGTDHQTLLAPVFERLTQSDAIGRCTKCHSVDDEGAQKHPKWRGFSTRRVKNRFTTFSHEPHISTSGTKGCALCHQLSRGSDDFLRTYKGGDATVFDSNFNSIDKSTCSACHTSQAAGETCTLCHNYHATEISRARMNTRIP